MNRIEEQARYYRNIPLRDRSIKAVVHLEDAEDILFWNNQLQKAASAKYHFITYSKNDNGNALIVIDVARNGNKVAIMCAEGNTPARELHIVRNHNPMQNPWFFFDGDESTLWVSVFHFNKNELRHY